MYARTMKNLDDRDRWHTPCCFRPQAELSIIRSRKESRIRKTVGISLLILVCVVALSAPVAAASGGFVVTNPATLVVLGAALISVGVWTRRLFFRQERES